MNIDSDNIKVFPFSTERVSDRTSNINSCEEHIINNKVKITSRDSFISPNISISDNLQIRQLSLDSNSQWVIDKGQCYIHGYEISILESIYIPNPIKRYLYFKIKTSQHELKWHATNIEYTTYLKELSSLESTDLDNDGKFTGFSIEISDQDLDTVSPSDATEYYLKVAENINNNWIKINTLQTAYDAKDVLVSQTNYLRSGMVTLPNITLDKYFELNNNIDDGKVISDVYLYYKWKDYIPNNMTTESLKFTKNSKHILGAENLGRIGASNAGDINGNELDSNIPLNLYRKVANRNTIVLTHNGSWFYLLEDSINKTNLQADFDYEFSINIDGGEHFDDGDKISFEVNYINNVYSIDNITILNHTYHGGGVQPVHITSIDVDKVVAGYNSYARILISPNHYDLIIYSANDIYSPYLSSSLFVGLDKFNPRYIYFNKLNTGNSLYINSMFSSCAKLLSLDLSSFDTSNVIDMNNVFSFCYDLISLDLSSFDTSNVINMPFMFRDCNSLKSINVSSFNTSNVIDMQYMFYGCSQLTSIDISNFDCSNVVLTAAMFQACTKLVYSDLSNINFNNVEISNGMFEACSSLESVTLSNTLKPSICAAMFANCTNLSYIDLTHYDIVPSFCIEMFKNCSNLSKIYVNAGTDWTNIAGSNSANMFTGCVLLPNYSSSNQNDATQATTDSYFTAVAIETWLINNTINALTPTTCNFKSKGINFNGIGIYFINIIGAVFGYFISENIKYPVALNATAELVWFDEEYKTIQFYEPVDTTTTFGQWLSANATKQS